MTGLLVPRWQVKQVTRGWLPKKLMLIVFIIARLITKKSVRGAFPLDPAAAKKADTIIRDHPYESIGVAFGVGLLLGVLVTRK